MGRRERRRRDGSVSLMILMCCGEFYFVGEQAGRGVEVVGGWCSHDEEIEGFERLVGRSRERDLGGWGGRRGGVYALIVGSDGNERVAMPGGLDGIGEALEMGSHLLSRLGSIETDGVEAIVFGDDVGGREGPSVGDGCGGGERAGVLARVGSGVMEIEIEEMLVAAEDIVAELALGEIVLAHVGHGGIFTHLAVAV